MAEKSTYKIAVVGPEDMISGFNALGVDVFFADNSQDTLTQIKSIRKETLSEDGKEKHGVIMVIDSLIEDIPDDEYARITEGALPTLITIPGINSDKDSGTRKLRAMAEKAIGSDILS